VSDHDAVKFIYAAGGLLWRDSAQGRQILVIHRLRYDDWSLPKGKLESGEGWEEAALREIKEETHYEANLESFAGVTTYMHGKRPKVVLFWNMTPLSLAKPDQSLAEEELEVSEARWVSVEEATKLLDYTSEATLVRQNMKTFFAEEASENGGSEEPSYE
jgi:8-oxo-dGTP diphosphatase